MDYQAIRAFAIQTARKAGANLMYGFTEHKEIERKSSRIDLVTQFDKESEALIIKEILEHYPETGIVAEEGSSRNPENRYRWYIDPLDGTNNFVHGIPIFSVSMALYDGNEPLVGVVYDPTRDECFTAVRGGGASLIHRDTERPLSVSQNAPLSSCIVATGFPYDHMTSPHNNIPHLGEVIRHVQGIRRCGSAAMDMAYIAAGRFDAYWEFKLHRWDVAAGILLVQEAGGQVNYLTNEPFEQASQLALAASNGRVQQELLAIIRAVPIPSADD